MQTMLITVVAMQDQEPVLECQGEIDLTTFEITELTDQTFHSFDQDTYDGFALELDGKYYPIGVDYLDTGNEFMLMDASGVDAILEYADDHPDEVDGEIEDDPIDDADFGEDEDY